MQLRNLLVPALLLGAALAQPAAAQTVLPLSFEVRGGVVIPRGDFDDGANTGWSVGGTIHYRVAPMVSVYGGFEHAAFTVDDDEDFEGVDADITDQGFRLGARFDVPLGSMTGIGPWVEGGATFNQTSIGLSDGSTSLDVDSDRGVGFEVGAGLSFAVAPKISITPGVRYRSHKAKFSDPDGGTEEAEVDVNYFSIDLGVHIRL
ncbi:MAG TPA: outer membrane beta-barrel protein [Longimicrobium sp.]|jgi:opacity protein-like surface antigen|nr:outer membrane beta-barrel protein [Longimicrobium sp.]